MSTLFRRAGSFLHGQARPFLRARHRKPAGRVAREVARYSRAYGTDGLDYFRFGLYVEGIDGDVVDFLPKALIYRWFAAVNRGGAQAVNDKVRFRGIMEAAGVPCVREILLLRPGGAAVDADGRALSPAEAEGRLREAAAATGGPLFAKPVGRYGGRGARLFHPERERLAALAGGGETLLVQPRLRQHPALDRLHPGSVNTVRVDTLLLEDGTCVHNGAALRIGSGGSVVDSGSLGGILVPVDLVTGALGAKGRRNPGHDPDFLERHPDTGIPFGSVTIPFWGEIRALVARGAAALRPLRSLGWDVAVTPEGPVAIEANAHWAPESFQFSRGLRPTPLGRLVLAHRRGARPPAGGQAAPGEAAS